MVTAEAAEPAELCSSRYIQAYFLLRTGVPLPTEKSRVALGIEGEAEKGMTEWKGNRAHQSCKRGFVGRRGIVDTRMRDRRCMRGDCTKLFVDGLQD